MRSLIAATLLASASTLAAPAAAMVHETNLPPTARDVDRFAGPILAEAKDAAALNARCDEYVAEIERRIVELESETGAATVDGTLQHYDDLTNLMNSGWSEFALYSQIMLDEERREAGDKCTNRFAALESRMFASRPIYDRLVAIDLEDADAKTNRYVQRTRDSFERAGIGEDAEKRAEIKALNDRIAELGTTFDQNIAKSRNTVLVEPSRLAGLPQDYIDAHPANEDGLVEISTDYPDMNPVLDYADDENLRREMLEAHYTRAYPENVPVLKDLIDARNDLALMLGRPDFATLAVEDKMVNTPEKIEALMAEAARAARPAAEAEYARKLSLWQETHPGATSYPLWSESYLSEKVKEQDYALDSQEVRKYFTYDNVRDGILQLSEDLFGIDIRPWDTPTWNEDVETYEVFDGGKLLGRFYLDSHPRPGKFSHANHITLRNGVAGRTVPHSALTMNLPKGGYETGLMSLDDTETFLHEFGHLLHNILGGNQRWAGQAGTSVEWDFVEAPSQMLEEWIYDYDTLTRFAVNEQGEKLPRELFDKMDRARKFGRGMFEYGQLGLANQSLGLYQGPAPDDVIDRARELNEQYSLFETPDFWKRPASFGHLNGYSSIYYTYLWSRVISADLFSRFEAAGLRDPETAAAYRRLILAPGGSVAAADSVRAFLGRDISYDAFRANLEVGEGGDRD